MNSRYFIWLIILSVLYQFSYAQNSTQITAVQYYFNTDPGVGVAGNGSILNVGPVRNYSATLSIPVPGSLSGFNNLYVRAKDQSGRWSIAERSLFYVTTPGLAIDMDTYQYYFDTDPGVGVSGNGSVVSMNPASVFNQPLTISVPGTLTDGYHNLYMRTRNVNGQWSITERSLFYVRTTSSGNPIVAYQYYFDTDPGVGIAGNGNVVSVSPTTSYEQNISILIPNSLAGGFHNLYVRTQDGTGHWSIIERSLFYVGENNTSQQVVALEYYYDNDPGVGNGMDIPVTASSDLNITTNLSTTGLTKGSHIVYIRAKDNAGRWSIIERNSLNIENSISVPVITPAGPFTLCQGLSITLSVVPEVGVSFQWLLNGSPITGETSPSLLISQAGDYSVTATSGIEVLTSSVVTATMAAGTAQTYYADVDGDGYGNPLSSVLACSPPSGYVTNNTDCYDTNPYAHPGATEICGNGVDDDCDGLIDNTTVQISAVGQGKICSGSTVILGSSYDGGNALSFSGMGYVSMPDVANINSYTIEFWFNPDADYNASNTTAMYLYERSENSGAGTQIYFDNQNYPGGHLIFKIQNNFLDRTALLSVRNNWSAGTWYHVAVTYANSTGEMKMYVNGVMESSTVRTGTYSSGSFVSQAIGNGDNVTAFHGRMDEFRLWKYVRTANDISSNYNKAVPYSSSDLKVYYNAESFASQHVNDVSGNGYNGYLQFGSGSWSVPSTAPIEYASYSWSTGDTTSTTTVSVSGVYTLEVMTSAGCSASASVTVEDGVVPAPVITPSGSTTFCAGGNVNLYTNYSNSNALSFDGVNDYVAIPSNPLLALQDFTLEYWVRTFSQAGYERITSEDNDAFETATSGTDFKVYGGQFGFGWTTVASASPNTWTHMAYVRNGNVFSVYQNGIQVFSAPCNQTPLNPHWNLGGRWGGNGEYAQVDLAEFRVWSVARSASEISSNYNHNVSPTSSGLLMYYNFASGTGTTAIDATPNGINGTIQNGPQYLSIPSGLIGASGTGYSYLWSTGSTEAMLSVSATGTYSVVVTNSDGCSGTSSVLTTMVNENPIVSISQDRTVVDCRDDLGRMTVKGAALILHGPGQSGTSGNWFDFSNFTVEMWVKPETVQSDLATLVSVYSPTGLKWSLQQNTTGILPANTYFINVDGLTLDTFVLTPNVWQHIALTKNNSDLSIFVDGTLIVSGTVPSNYSFHYPNHDSQFILGLDPVNNTNSYWNGAVDELRVYEGAISSGRILSEMYSSVDPNVSDMRAYYKMDFTSTSVQGDDGPFGHHLMFSVVTQMEFPSTAPVNSYTNILWSTGETMNSIITPVTGTYSVTVSSGNGCTASASMDMEIDMAQIPAPVLFTALTAPCNNSQVSLTTVGNSLQLNGSSQFANLGNWFNYQNFTIEMWVKPGSTQMPYADILDNNHGLNQNWVLQQSGTTANNYYFYLSGQNTPGFQLAANTWQHLAIVKSQSKIRVYINGSIAIDYALPANFTINYSNPLLHLGRLTSSSDRFWNGLYDEVRMYDYPRAQSEILYEMYYSVPASNVHLKAYYRMDEMDGMSIHDISSNAHNGLLYNDPVFNIPSTAPINYFSSYLWSTGETTSTITGQVGTSYSVTVTNVIGCSMTSDLVVADNPGLNPAAIPTPEIFSTDYTPCTPGMATLSTVGNSLQLNGTDQYAEFGNWFNYQNFTIEMWVKPGATQLPFTDIIENNHAYGANWVLQQWPGNTNMYFFLYMWSIHIRNSADCRCLAASRTGKITLENRGLY
ncbi:MAG: hypothetical protein IPP86_04330 [Bacteroidetes bacterium]|nr:hypothetical protein [Bacteroidota bacterium]